MPPEKPAKTAAKKPPRKRSKRKTIGPRRRRRRSRSSGILATVQAARAAAANALRTLRAEIRQAQARLQNLIESERSFRTELFGGARSGARGRARQAKRAPGARPPRRKGPPIADRFFKKLPKSFTLDDLRKVAGRLTGVSLAQWGRSKKVKKIGKGKYQKAA